MRETLNPPSSPLRDIDGEKETPRKVVGYEDVKDPVKLKRLITARERTKVTLEQKAAWVGLERSRAVEGEVDGAKAD